MIRWLHLNLLIITGCWFLPGALWAHINLLDLETHPEIGPTGRVTIRFKIRNHSDAPLFQLHPMFHFHHVKSRMPVIPHLGPGEIRTLVNTQHPRVLRVGRYPLITMVRYSTSQDSPLAVTQNLMDSFYFKEELQSAVEGRLRSEPDGQVSLLKILLKNQSRSFKNIRLMLLLPPGLQAEVFGQGMLGFSIWGGEEKQFEFPVIKKDGLSGGDYPVHLMIEYGEMQKHYSDEVVGTVHFGMSWKEIPFWSHVLTLCAFTIFLFWIFRLKRKKMVRSPKVE